MPPVAASGAREIDFSLLRRSPPHASRPQARNLRVVNHQMAEITIREAVTIWHEQGGWFDARWHFSSTATAIRVFKDDRIMAGAEWPMQRAAARYSIVTAKDFDRPHPLAPASHA